MALLFLSDFDDPVAWRKALAAAAPDLEFRVWPEAGDITEIEVALVWQPPPGLLASLPQLRLVQSLGAGIDHLLAEVRARLAALVRNALTPPRPRRATRTPGRSRRRRLVAKRRRGELKRTRGKVRGEE